MDNNADSHFFGKSELNLANQTSRDLIALWHSGSQEAARVLLARYEVRLIALVASRLNQKYRASIPPEDVVQSAMGSFFRVTRASNAIQLESTASAWNILATFVRRKLSRALEREAAAKRGGNRTRVPLNDLDPDLNRQPSSTEADEILADVHTLLNQDQSHLLELLLTNATQPEIAEQLGVDERTIRRRMAAIRQIVHERLIFHEAAHVPPPEPLIDRITLPNIHYREFVLGKLLGRGALGKVYRARLQADGHVVAVKFMHRYLWSNPVSRSSFLREIDHASKVDHPGVAKYFGWGQSPHGGHYLVCEYIDGQPMSALRPSDSETALEWLTQVCHAVAAAHQAGVVHGDLTPNNVLICHDDKVVITDFGFATISHQARHDGLAAEWMTAPGGTLGFAAPEQISAAFGTIGFATDIYAIGGLAYYLSNGRSPHDGQMPIDTITEDDVSVRLRHATQADSTLLAIARMALKKAVASRPQSMAELFAQLSL